MHRLAWVLMLAGVGFCVAGNFPDGTLVRSALFAGAVLLVVAGGWVAWANGRRIQGQWQHEGVRGELEILEANAESAQRMSVVGTLHLPGRAPRQARFTAHVPVYDHSKVIAGARLPCTVLDADPGRIRVQVNPSKPLAAPNFVEQP